MENWMSSQDRNEDIVLSTRIRLARNISNIPFPHKLKLDESKKIVKEVEEVFNNSFQDVGLYKTIYLWEKQKKWNEVLFEKRLISKKLLHNPNKAAVIMDKDETVSIMINEEDHIRIQCINAGLNLKETLKVTNEIDNLLEQKLDYAFDERLGYLTACPTNSGSGLRGSVMIHLPALTIEKEMERIFNTVTQVGMTIRGLYGEGSKTQGNIYQISNQITLGLDEEEIINNLEAVVNQIINKENLARLKIEKKFKYELDDKIFRSLGILKSAVLLSLKECLDLLSNVRMGVELGIIKDIDKSSLNTLLVDISSAAIQNMTKNKLTEKEIDLKRAEIVKNKIG